jgi:hypothetical protein
MLALKAAEAGKSGDLEEGYSYTATSGPNIPEMILFTMGVSSQSLEFTSRPRLLDE